MQNRLDIVTEIDSAFSGSRFRQKDFLSSLNLKDTKRAKKLWAALKRVGRITKTPHKDFAWEKPQLRIVSAA